MPRLLAALVLFLALATHARAQDEPINEAGPLAQPFSARSLAAYIKTAALSPDQTAAARSLHQGYRAAYTAATKKARTRTEDLAKEIRDGKNDWSKFAQERGKVTTEYVDQARALEKGLLDDLRALTTPEQADRVAAAERARRRETGFLFALGAGERLDLVSMLAAQKIDPKSTPALAELVSRWELDVDRLLTEKDKVILAGMRKMMEGGPDRPEEVGKVIGDMAAISARVGEANRRAAAEAQPLLSEDKQAAFANDIKLRTYPRIWGPSTFETAATAAQKFKDLTPDQRAKLTDLLTAYQRDAQSINTRWASAADQKIRDMAASPMQIMMTFERGQGDPTDPFIAARTDRKNLDDRSKSKLHELLTAAQKDQLPKEPDHARNHIPEFLPDFEADVKSDWEQWKGEGD